jgi:hypothetical protein
MKWLPVSNTIEITSLDSLRKESTKQTWNIDSNNYINSLRTIETINDDQQLIEIYSETWNLSKNDRWIPNLKHTYYYSSDKIEHTSTLLWDSMLGDWKSSIQNVYSYTDTNSTSYIIQSWNIDESIWKNLRRITYFYTNPLNPINNSTDNSINIFPNPVKNDLNVETSSNIGADITIFNISGDKILSINSKSPSFSINLRNIPNGFYIAEIGFNNKTIRKSFVKN